MKYVLEITFISQDFIPKDTIPEAQTEAKRYLELPNVTKVDIIDIATGEVIDIN